MNNKIFEPEFQERFWAKVEKGNKDECWKWIGAKYKNGYGYIWIVRKREQIKAHRLSFIYEHGSLKSSLCVLHKCDNPECVNPSHLVAGTRADNNRDRSNKGRGRENRQWGEDNSNVKITAKDVKKILKMADKKTQAEIGKIFGIGQAQVSRIIRQKSWKRDE